MDSDLVIDPANGSTVIQFLTDSTARITVDWTMDQLFSILDFSLGLVNESAGFPFPHSFQLYRRIIDSRVACIAHFFLRGRQMVVGVSMPPKSSSRLRTNRNHFFSLSLPTDLPRPKLLRRMI